MDKCAESGMQDPTLVSLINDIKNTYREIGDELNKLVKGRPQEEIQKILDEKSAKLTELKTKID